MKQVFALFLISSGLLLSACGGNNTQETEAAKIDSATNNTSAAPVEKTYDVALVDNKKDPSCGMPTTAGISDTAHYENKVLGFCSTECKNEFLKNPKAGIAAAEIK